MSVIQDYTMKLSNLNQVHQAQREDLLYLKRLFQSESDLSQTLKSHTTTRELYIQEV